MTQDHIHDCTGPDLTCPCGFKFTVPRFSVGIDIWDNETKASIVADGHFSTNSVAAMVATLRETAAQIERNFR